MKVSLKRVLALALCAAMLFGLMPMQQAKADDYFIGGFIANNTAELVEALTEAERMVAPEKVVTIQIGEPFELTENVSVPGGCRLDVPVPFTIGEGVTMSVFGDLEVTAEMSNKGTLNNNNNVTVYGNAGGSLAFAATGKYTGTGMMTVINSTYEDIVPGMDLSKVNIEQGQGIGGIRWYITAKESAELVPDEWGNYAFSTMEELKQLTAATYDSPVHVTFEGEEFTFEDVVIPQNMVLTMDSYGIKIPAGCEVVVNGTVELHCVSLGGTLRIGDAGFVTVTGDLIMDGNCSIIGAERVRADNGMIQRLFDVNSTEELVWAANKAARPVLENAQDIIKIKGTFELDQNVTIPAGCVLRAPVPFTIAQGVTLTIDGNVELIMADATNYGTIKNNGVLRIYGSMGSTLTFAETGSYTGSGAISISGSTYEGIVPGLDLTAFSKEFREGFGGTWTLTYNGPSEPVPDPDGFYHFTTFAELQQLAAMEFDGWTAAFYDGSEDFVFDNITLPANLEVNFSGSTVVIPEWITVEADVFSASWLTVNGNLHTTVTVVDESLAVTGTLTVKRTLSMRNYTELVGADYVVLVNDWAQMIRNCSITSLEELEACIAEADSCTDHRIVYELYVENEMELTKGYGIPSNANFRLRAPVTIAQGAILTLNGENNDLHAPLTIAGTLANNGALDCAYDVGGLMDFTQGGSYMGQGRIYIEAETLTIENLGAAFPGLSGFDGYEAIQEEWGWTLRYVWNNNGDLRFTTMEELKQLASQTYDSWTWANYAGSEPFVIDESIKLPNNLPLGSNGAEIVIGEGVVVDVREAHFDKLVVNGTLNVESLQIYKQLDVNGTLNIRNSAYFNMDVVINGAENISYAGNATMGYWCEGYDLQSLKEACVLAANETNPKVRYSFFLQQEGTLTEDLVIPANMMLNINASLTVAAGATLTNYANMYMYAPVTVQGALQNDGWAMVDYPNAKLTIAEGATYSAEGALVIHNITDGDPMKAVPGIDLTGYELSQWDNQNTWQIAPEGYNPGGEGGGGLTFSSVEELKELATQSWDSWTWYRYVGEGALEITEDITLPENLNIRVNGEVRIPAGVNAWFNYLECFRLEVAGELNVSYLIVEQTSLKVTGSLTAREGITISEQVILEGRDKIIFTNQWSTITVDCNDVDMNRLKELNEEVQTLTDSRMQYAAYLNTSEIVLEESLEINSKLNVYFQGPLTVAEGVTLTLNSENAQLYAPATVYGTLENNSWLFVNAWDGVTLTIAEGGAYTGRGTIAFEKPGNVSVEEVVPGLDLSQWQVEQDGDTWHYICPIGGGGGGNNGLSFSTMEQLQALAAEYYDWGYITYTGNSDFVITEDIALPMNTYVDFGEYNVVVNEGVTAKFESLYCGDLTVYGDLTANYPDVMGDLAVYGTMSAIQVGIRENAVITGFDRIKFVYGYISLCRYYDVHSEDEFLAALNKAAKPQVTGESSVVQFVDMNSFVLTKDAALPVNCTLYINCDMIVAEGVTLTNNGSISIGPSLTVNGTLVNNNYVYTWDASVIFTETGKYEGRGILSVYGGTSYQSVFQGLNWDDFQITNNYDEWKLIYVAGLTPVATPSELEWGYTYVNGTKEAFVGSVSWKTGITNTNGLEYIYFYRINEDGTETLMNAYGARVYNEKKTGDYNCSYIFIENDFPSGKYYFTVYSCGDYVNTKDSAVARSAVWEYTKSGAALKSATNLGWSEDSFRAEWTNPNGDDAVADAIVTWYYKDRENGYEAMVTQIEALGKDYDEIPESVLISKGPGYYSYEVRFLSADVTKADHSEASARSSWYHLEKLPETPVLQLGGMVNDPTKTDEEKLEEIQNIGTEVLKEIIQEAGTGLGYLEQLENAISGGAAQIEVSEEVAAIVPELNVKEIYIMGATLNSKENKDEDVKLVIDKVEEVRNVSGGYNAASAVQFSMTLDNVKDTKNLEVPVYVSMPIPAGLDARNVVVLHYHDDGTYDVIHPEIYIVNGKGYADFILTSFSDFVMAEKLDGILGDVDHSETVDVDDVLALLWAVLFPDDFPIDVDADFDHNGSVDVDDVLTLLWYVLFPDDYPLN